MWQKSMADFQQNLSLGVYLILECSHEFLECSQSNDLDLLRLVNKTGLDLLKTILPFSLGKIGLCDVEYNIFKLWSKKSAKISKVKNLRDLFWLSILQSTKDVCLYEFLLLVADLWSSFQLLGHVLTHILLVCGWIMIDFPSFIDLIFEESYRLKVNLFTFKLASINFGEFSWLHDDLHHTREALILELSLHHG